MRKPGQRDVEELRSAIIAADSRGDTATLKELQREFRSGGFATTRISSEIPVLVAPDGRRYGGGPAHTGVVDRAGIVNHWQRVASRVKALADEAQAGAPTTLTRSTSSGVARGRRVVFSPLGMDYLRENPFDHGVEAGGALCGMARDDGSIVIMATGRSRTDGLMSRVSFSLDDLLEDSERFRGQGWTLVGDWHNHRGSLDNDALHYSNGDRTAWQGCADRSGHEWVGIVLGPGQTTERNGDEWLFPKVKGWLATPGRSDIQPIVVESDWTPEAF